MAFGDPNDPAYAAALGDSSYTAPRTGLAKQLQALIEQYGDSSLLTPTEAATYAISPNSVSAADTNPYSTVNQLKQQLSGDQYGITNNANAHGALFSGAEVAGGLHEDQAGAQRSYNAVQTLLGNIGGLDTTNTNNLSNAYGTEVTNALNTPTPAPVAAPTVAPTAAGYDPNPSATAGLPPISTITPANAAGDPRTGTSLYNPIAKPLTPKISLGHV